MASLYFPGHTNMEKAENDVKAVMEKMKWPDGVKIPQITRVSTNSFPIMRLSLTSSSDGMNENQLRTSLQEKVVNEMKHVPGVREVRVTGAGKNGYLLTLNHDAVNKYGLTMKDVQNALSSIHPTMPQGTIQESGGPEGKVTMPIRVTDWPINSVDLKSVTNSY